MSIPRCDYNDTAYADNIMSFSIFSTSSNVVLFIIIRSIYPGACIFRVTTVFDLG